jgi:hypothetical protein
MRNWFGLKRGSAILAKPACCVGARAIHVFIAVFCGIVGMSTSGYRLGESGELEVPCVVSISSIIASAAAPAATTDKVLGHFIRHHGRTSYHPVETSRMGSADKAVVGTDLNSILPSLVGSIANAPTAMIGEKATDLLRVNSRAPRSLRVGEIDSQTVLGGSRLCMFCGIWLRQSAWVSYMDWSRTEDR